MDTLKRFSLKKALSGITSYHGNSDYDLRIALSLPPLTAEEEEIAVYQRKYIYNNKLHSYLNGFKELDNILNVFFVSYGKLERSSLNCAKLWVGAMEVRFILINAVTHLVEHHRNLSYEYKALRMDELNHHIITLKNCVAELVQYVVIFQKHNETWRFKRAKFLEELREELYEKVQDHVEEYRDFLKKSYGMKESVAEAYVKHLERQKLKARKALHDVEPLSIKGKGTEKLFQKLKQAVDVLKGPKLAERNKRLAEKMTKENYQGLRVLLTASKDALAPRDNEIFNYDWNNKEEIGALLGDDIQQLKLKKKEKNKKYKILIAEAQDLAEKLVAKEILEADKQLHPHEQGLKSIGPFELIILSNADTFVDINIGNKWTLSNVGIQIDGLTCLEEVEGNYIQAGETSRDKRTRQSLKLHPNAQSYAWFFPLDLSTLSREQVENIQVNAHQYSPLHALVFYGAFGYFDENDRLVELKGIILGDDMYFDGPYAIPKDDTFETLEKEGMPLVATSMPGLEDYSCTYISREHKDIIANTKNKGQDTFAGAFAYKGKGGKEHLQSYFQINTFRELKIKEQINSNTPIMEHIPRLYNLYKDEWLGTGLVLEEDIPQTEDPSHMWHITYNKSMSNMKERRNQRRNEFMKGQTMFRRETHFRIPRLASGFGSM
eukprot:snap_masked-scaffold_44-processed-gene-1.86-mRNA-1 protein AED:1.00 eAED:1.00 QI:0/-1/0/0/-1/1/1/0/662